MASPTPKSPAPGTYRFIVRSVHEALSVLKAQLGPEARVLSVRPVRQNFLRRIFGGAKLEVIAELAAPNSALEPAMAPPVAGVLNSAYAAGLARGSRPVDLRTALRTAGFSESLIWRVETERRWSISGAQPLGEALADFVHELRQLVGAFPVVPLSRRVVFISSSQADKSLALGQWLTREVFQEGTKCRVRHVEFSRPNPCLELEVFCDAVGVALTHHTPDVRVNDEGARVYWDVPCFGPAAGDEMSLLAELLEQQAIETRVLVLNAAYETESLQAGLKSGRALRATHVVLTHLDEAKNVGKIWEILLEGELRPPFFSHNGNMLGPIGSEPLDFLAEKTLGKS